MELGCKKEYPLSKFYGDGVYHDIQNLRTNCRKHIAEAIKGMGLNPENKALYYNKINRKKAYILLGGEEIIADVSEGNVSVISRS